MHDSQKRAAGRHAAALHGSHGGSAVPKPKIRNRELAAARKLASLKLPITC